MLKSCKKITTLVINGEAIYQNESYYPVLKDESVVAKETILVEGDSFDKFYKDAKGTLNECGTLNKHIGSLEFGVWFVGKTLFKKRRYVMFQDWVRDISYKYIDNGEPFSYYISVCYVEAPMTMNRLFELNSEKVIQYLKERGMNTCPMIK